MTLAFQGACVRAGSSTINDDRDHAVYGLVTIGGQVWLDHNANFATKDSWCPGNLSENCAKYGRIYSWAAAKAACPKGAHLPSDAELTQLEQAVGGDANKLKGAKYAGTNEHGRTGFNAQPGGVRNPDGSFQNVGAEATLWSSTAKDDTHAFKRWIMMNSAIIQREDRPKDFGYQVRCLKN